jgi:hypothetical protein
MLQAGDTRSSRGGRGKKTGGLSGPYFARSTVNGKQIWHKLGADTFEQAKAESDLAAAAIAAAKQGLTVTDADALANRNRVSIQHAVDAYLDLKRGKRPKTVHKYTHALNRFIAAVAPIRFLDEIDVDALRKIKRSMEDLGYSAKTIADEISIVTFLLKKNGVIARLPKDEFPRRCGRARCSIFRKTSCENCLRRSIRSQLAQSRERPMRKS